MRDALNVLDNDIELLNILNHSHTNNMWKTIIDYNVKTKGIDNTLAELKNNKATIPAEVIKYALELKSKGSGPNETT